MIRRHNLRFDSYLKNFMYKNILLRNVHLRLNLSILFCSMDWVKMLNCKSMIRYVQKQFLEVFINK